ncbi:unnamed protein product [Prunus armeniaca]
MLNGQSQLQIQLLPSHQPQKRTRRSTLERRKKGNELDDILFISHASNVDQTGDGIWNQGSIYQ